MLKFVLDFLGRSKVVIKEVRTEDILIAYAEKVGWFYPESIDNRGVVTLIRFGIEQFGVVRSGSSYKRKASELVKKGKFQVYKPKKIAYFNIKVDEN